MPGIELAIVLGTLALGWRYPDMAEFILNAINAYLEYDMMTETRDRLFTVIDRENALGSELWAKEVQNLSWRQQYWEDVWDSQDDIEYTQCDVNKPNRALVEQRWRTALLRDQMLDSSNMYAIGFKEDIINRHISKDTHIHAQAWLSAKWHEENHVLDSLSKYHTLIMSMVRGVPYGQLPAYLGRVGDAYEQLYRMHSTSMNNSLAAAGGALERMVNGQESAVTSRDLAGGNQKYEDSIEVGIASQDYIEYAQPTDSYSTTGTTSIPTITLESTK